MFREPSLNEVWRERQKALGMQGEMTHASYGRHNGYDPNQPRLPKGNPDGGQWTDEWPGELRQILADVAALAAPLAERVVREVRPDLPRVWSQYAQAGTGYGGRSPEIEIMEGILQTVLTKVNAEVAAGLMGPVRANVYGIAVHTLFANAVCALNLPGIEQKGGRAKF